MYILDDIIAAFFELDVLVMVEPITNTICVLGCYLRSNITVLGLLALRGNEIVNRIFPIPYVYTYMRMHYIYIISTMRYLPFFGRPKSLATSAGFLLSGFLSLPSPLPTSICSLVSLTSLKE